MIRFLAYSLLRIEMAVAQADFGHTPEFLSGPQTKHDLICRHSLASLSMFQGHEAE
jgi:hypothetical protein